MMHVIEGGGVGGVEKEKKRKGTMVMSVHLSPLFLS